MVCEFLSLIPGKVYVKIELESSKLYKSVLRKYKSYISLLPSKRTVVYYLLPKRLKDCNCRKTVKIQVGDNFLCSNIEKFVLCYHYKFSNIYLLDSILRVAASIILSYHNGCLLHSAGIVENGQSFLFCGPSQSGKSTLVKQIAKSKVLSDEICPIIVIGNNIYTWRSMFYSEVSPEYKDLKLIKVKKIYFLSNYRIKITPQQSYNKMDKFILPMNKALELLLKNVLWFTDNIIITEKLISILLKVSKNGEFHLM
ncbi:MAG: hypothetical protein N2Z73_05010 [Endomicrobia bacterium]|nr:hypothetical protein [Endomicrobiia bacterium]